MPLSFTSIKHMSITLETFATAPVKATGQSWDAYTETLEETISNREFELLTEIPTPPITAEAGTDAWDTQFFAQRKASLLRNEATADLKRHLIVAVGQSIQAELPAFRCLAIDFQGTEDCRFCGKTYAYLAGPLNNIADEILPASLQELLAGLAWDIANDYYPHLNSDDYANGTLELSTADGDKGLRIYVSHLIETTDEKCLLTFD